MMVNNIVFATCYHNLAIPSVAPGTVPESRPSYDPHPLTTVGAAAN